MAGFRSLGYKPRAPVPFEDFLDDSKREGWIRDKNMLVFSMFSPDHEATEIDVFVISPFNFEHAYSAAATLEVSPGVVGSFCGLEELIEMKRKSGRPIDLEDIAQLDQFRKPE